MKSDYITRARKFIRALSEFLPNDGYISNYTARHACDMFNARYHRHVVVDFGSARVAFITSDYVVKLDYDKVAVRLYGGCKSECRFYQFALEEGMEYLLAEITPYKCNGVTFYIMPRVSNVGNADAHYLYRLSEDEYEWLMQNINDLHEFNYGLLHGRVVVIDYAMNGLFEEGG